MPSDLRRISWLAIFLLVVLRISIGWHLFYEGVWKLNTRKTASPWTAEGYLKNSTGPLRTTFRNMTGDPNDLKWLDFDTVSAKWDAWRDRFVTHYHLDDKQVNSLALLLDGPDDGFSVNLDDLPSGVNLDEVIKSASVAKGAIKYDAKSKKLIVDGKLHLLPIEQARLIEEVNELRPKPTDGSAQVKSDPAYDKIVDAIKAVASRSARLSFRERLAGMLKGDPDRVGNIQKAKADGELDLVVSVGEVKYYQELIQRFEKNYAKAHTKSEWDHIERQWSDLQAKRRSLVGPVQALEKDLLEEANKLLTKDQFALGAVPDAVTEMTQINDRTIWGLIVIGFLLIAGLLTRLSALGGAALLTLFYLAMPPWPGVQEIPSIEHNYIVNKLSVEIVALLAIAAMPSGKWFGLDALVSALFGLRSGGKKIEK